MKRELSDFEKKYKEIVKNYGKQINSAFEYDDYELSQELAGGNPIPGLRDLIFNEWFIPVAKQILIEDKNVESVYVSCSQYWDDEADDACHVKFFPSSQKDTSWENLFSESNSFYEKEDNYGYLSCASYNVKKQIVGNYYLDNDPFFITEISPFCKEASQEDNYEDSYQPLIIVSRDENSDDFSVRFVGDMIRVFK